MQKNKILVFIMLGGLLSLGGCKADVDLNNIDGKADVKFGLGLPVGSMRAYLSDFLGEVGDNLFVDTIKHIGVITYQDTIHISRNFHEIQLDKYASTSTEHFPFAGVFPDDKITGSTTRQCAQFKFDMVLNNVNDDLDNERIDSMLVQSAKFTSTLDVKNLPIEWEWVERIELGLGQAFSCKNGKRVTIYDYHDDRGKYNYTDSIPINLNDFSINLMKDREKIGEVTNKVTYVLYFYFTVPTGKTLTIAPDATLDFNLHLDFLAYDAIWGMFAPSDEMRDEDILVIADEWAGWNKFKKAKLPFAEPTIDLRISTQIAGHLVLKGDYLYTKSLETGDSVLATFDNTGSHYYERIIPDNVILSLKSPITSVMRDYIYFSKKIDEGQLDKMLAIRPDVVGYKFSVEFFKPDVYKQGRLVKDTHVDIDAVTRLPFIFNQGVEVTYYDTLTNIQITLDELDSLVRESKWIDTLENTTVKLALLAKNTIPLEIKGILHFMDSCGNEIMEKGKDGQMHPFQITDDTIRFAVPTFEKIDGTTCITKPGETAIVVTIDKEHFDLVTQIKSIIFEGIIDDESVQAMQKKYLDLDIYPIRITNESNLNIKIGIAADVEGVLDVTAITDDNQRNK